MKIIIAAGGTGGHIYPGIAIAEELLSTDASNQVLFIGSKDGMEGSLVKYPLKLINSRGLLRKLSWKALSAPFVSLIGFFQAVGIIFNYKPDWVVATGGYVSLPVVLAAYFLRVPVLLHEQNVLPGITNRLCSRFAKTVTLSFPATLRYMQGLVTGNPVRKSILASAKNKSEQFTVLIFGGSQGSLKINQETAGMLGEFENCGINIIHISGTRDFKMLPKKKYSFYTLLPYMYNIEDALVNADLIISRAGATALSEILALGKPSILIPFPYSAEGHQEKNAEMAAEKGAAIVLPEKNLAQLPVLIKELQADPAKLLKMQGSARKIGRPFAAREIVKLLYDKK